MKLKLLDLCCGAGGAGYGYCLAGFDVTGVDINFQHRYKPGNFIQSDALEYLASYGNEYDVIHVSPPCQGYSITEPMKRNVRRQRHYPLLIEDFRNLLLSLGKPYVIENVPGAPLQNPLVLDGSMFGLLVRRKRLFECFPTLWFAPSPSRLVGRTARRGEYDRGQRGLVCVAGNNFDPVVGGRAMGIDWMVRDELVEAIPPSYTHWVGCWILRALAVTPV